MQAFRSHLYNVLFYVNLVVWLIAASVTFVLPRMAIIRVAQNWGRFNLWLLRVIVGTRVEFRGRERIPPGPLLIASKHQSFLETFTVLFCVDDPAFILKRELQLIPVFGWLTIKAGMIAVRRGGTTALAEMNRQAREEIRRGRQIIIFPEGTRRAPGAEPAYKNGVAHLYRTLGAPCLPVALNSGLFWPRRHYIRRPGTVVISFLDVIPPGLDRETFLSLLQERIETASDALLAEAEDGRPGRPQSQRSKPIDSSETLATLEQMTNVLAMSAHRSLPDGASSSAGSAPREEPLRALAGAGDRLAMTSWRGRSGRRYVVSRHDAATPEIAETVEAVVVAVRRGRGGLAEAIGSAAFEPVPSPRERLGWLAAMRACGASEMHVHLVNDGPIARRAALSDLGGSAEV